MNPEDSNPQDRILRTSDDHYVTRRGGWEVTVNPAELPEDANIAPAPGENNVVEDI